MHNLWKTMRKESLCMLAGGLVVGAAVALLFAPDKGSDLRKKIKKMFRDEYDKIKDEFEKIKDKCDIEILED